MISKTTFGIVALLVLGMLVLSGCTQSATNNTPGPSTGTGNTTVTTAQTSDQVAADLSGGTGTTASDISTTDLEGLQNDLDTLGTSIDATGQSNI